MPVVFVHGVGVRTGPEYWADLELRKSLIRDFLFEPLGLTRSTTIDFAYWGDHGATFRWDHGSLPSGQEEPMGSEDERFQDLVASYADADTGEDDCLLAAVARRYSIAAALDLMVVAAADGLSAEQAAELTATVKATLAALAAADSAPSPDWLADVSTDTEFLTALAGQTAASDGDEETFGGANRAWKRMRERLSRVRTTVPAVAGRAAGGAVRPRIHAQAATFIGDILVYLDRNPQIGVDPGPDGEQPRQERIRDAVAAPISAAIERASDQDPTVVIAHSMGGNIVYDLLSHYRTDLNIDFLISVGSQIGVFQELDLFAAKHEGLAPPVGKTPKPANIKRWLNVFDRNDILGFAASRVFDDVSDFEYGTGMGLVQAHSSYFVRPSFYERLAARITEAT